MPNIVKVVDGDGREHWTAKGSAAHQRLTAAAKKGAGDASDNAGQGDGDNAAAAGGGPGDGKTGDTRPARRRGSSAPEPVAGGEQQPGQ